MIDFIIKQLGIKGIFAFLAILLASLYGIQAHNYKTQVISLQTQLQARENVIKGLNSTITQNQIDYSAMQKSCSAEIQKQVEKAVKLKPICPNGAEPKYRLEDFFK